MFDKTIVLDSFSTIKLAADRVEDDVKFIYFRAYSQIYNITLSYENPNTIQKLSKQLSVNGTNVGLISVLELNQREAHVWLLNPHNESLEIYVIATLHQFQGVYWI